MKRFCIALAAALAFASPAHAATERVISVYDGDTFTSARTIKPYGFPLQFRLRGIDAPEMPPHAKCKAEEEAAIAAWAHLHALIAAGGGKVYTSNAGREKYGRILIDGMVHIGIHNIDLAAAQREAGLVADYEGGKRGGWCDLADTSEAAENPAAARTPAPPPQQ